MSKLDDFKELHAAIYAEQDSDFFRAGSYKMSYLSRHVSSPLPVDALTMVEEAVTSAILALSFPAPATDAIMALKRSAYQAVRVYVPRSWAIRYYRYNERHHPECEEAWLLLRKAVAVAKHVLQHSQATAQAVTTSAEDAVCANANSVYMCMYVCAHVCMCVCVYIYIYRHINIYSHIYT